MLHWRTSLQCTCIARLDVPHGFPTSDIGRSAVSPGPSPLTRHSDSLKGGSKFDSVPIRRRQNSIPSKQNSALDDPRKIMEFISDCVYLQFGSYLPCPFTQFHPFHLPAHLGPSQTSLPRGFPPGVRTSACASDSNRSACSCVRRTVLELD